MPPYDTHPALGHPEVAAWMLGALAAPEAEAFGEHLASCSQCQGALAEFESGYLRGGRAGQRSGERAQRVEARDGLPHPGVSGRDVAGSPQGRRAIGLRR